VTKLEDEKAAIWQAEFSPDGRRIVTANDDKRAGVRNAAACRHFTKPGVSERSLLDSPGNENSSASMMTESPIWTSAWPIFPCGPSIRIFSCAPNAFL